LAVVILLVIFFNAFRQLDRSKKRDRVFFWCLFSAIIFSLVDIADSVVQMYAKNYGALFTIRTLYYFTSSVPALLWFYYLCTLVYENQEKPFKISIWFGGIVYLIFCGFIFANIFTHGIFDFDADLNVIHNHFYFVISYGFSGFYALFFYVLLFINFRKIPNKHLFLALSFLPLIVLVGLLLEHFFNGWLMVGPAYSVALLFAYLFIQNSAVDRIIGELSYEASRDPLTGLYNRSYFEREMARDLNPKKEKLVALALIDIDGLKRINDTLGHPVGDEAIRKMGEILKKHLTSAEIIARIGGDEFAAIIIDKSQDELTNELISLLDVFRDLGVGVDGNKLPLRCSIGVAFNVDEAPTSEALYYHSDVALYSVKRGDKYSFAFYSPALEKEYKNPSKN
jgi:diguanylate cyclase (GGDEF)-like protein